MENPNKFEMYEDLYGKSVKMNDRFETEHTWSKELALKNRGRWIPKQQIPPRVEIHLKNPNECEHNLEVGCIKDVCDCYSLVSSEEELLSFILLAENREQALRMLKQWKQGFYSEEDLRECFYDAKTSSFEDFGEWFKNYKK